MKRRDFIKTTAAGLAVGGTAASVNTASADDYGIPYINTRGHFSVDLTWEFWDDGVYQDTLNREHSRYDYDTVGDIPWGADDIVIWIHGWGVEHDKARKHFARALDGLRDNGYEGSFVGYTYDVEWNPLYIWNASKWWAHFDIGKRNGPKLANFITDVYERNPDANIHLVGHSLGGQPIANAIEELDKVEASVETVLLLGVAINDQNVAMHGTYGPAFERNVGEVHNYYKREDVVLGVAFSVAEIETAVGEEGVQGTPPDNYTDHDVTDEVPVHSQYYYDVGIIDRIADQLSGEA